MDNHRAIGSTGVAGMAQLHQTVPLVERAHALIEQLRVRSPRATSGAALARRLGVSVRTIERDVARLIAAGVAIEAVRGPSGGYRLDIPDRLPPVTFTPGEAAALVATLVFVGPNTSATARAAFDKLLTVVTPVPAR